MTRAERELQARAKTRMATLARKRRDPRYLRTLGKFVAAGLLDTNVKNLPTVSGSLPLEDALFAGTIEPRVYELLPAVILKRPRLLALPEPLPVDLANVLRAIARGTDAPAFRGVPAQQYLPWVERTGRPGHGPALLKSVRLRRDDLQRLSRLQTRLRAKSQTDVLRTALRIFERVLDAESFAGRAAGPSRGKPRGKAKTSRRKA